MILLMRIAGLFVLAILLPSFAHADSPPALTTYTVSYSTIYPTATAESGLATTTSIDIAFSEQVKASIKIISSSGTLIKSLYTSSSVTNPTPKIWNGTNNAGALVGNSTYTILISATSTATSLTMTDSSKTIIVASSGDSDSSDSGSDTPTTTTPPSTSGSGPTEYLPIPALRIITNGDRTVSSGADIAFTAAVYDGKGNKRDDAMVTWSFGDGMRRTGASVFHRYYDPGEYLAVVSVTTSDGGDARREAVITVKNAGIQIVSVSSRGITLANSDSRTLDLSLWRLSMGGQEFRIPADTQILAGHTVLFPSQIIQLPVTGSATLLYPSGEVAVAYPAVAFASAGGGLASGKQLSSGATSYKSVEAVEPITSQHTNVQAYEKAVIAPSAVFATETAEGAALPPAKTSPAANTRATGFFRSAWTLGFLGIIALAGGAFIFL